MYFGMLKNVLMNIWYYLKHLSNQKFIVASMNLP